MTASSPPLSRRAWFKAAGTTLAGIALASRVKLHAQTPSHSPDAGVPPIVEGVRAHLNLNENPNGPSALALEAIQAQLKRPGRYPGVETKALLDLISKREGYPIANLILGVGSGQILETLGAHYGSLKGEVLYADPGFPLLAHAAQFAGGTAVTVPVNDKLETDLPGFTAKFSPNTRLVYLANPHNPTGTVVDPAALRDFIAATPRQIVIVVDEAYLDLSDDFHGRTTAALVKTTPNLVVLRTFSKVFGLAGLRVGYAVANPDVIAILRGLGVGGLTPNLFGVSAAAASLRDHGYIAKTKQTIVSERDKFTAILDELGHPYAKPQGNFVFFKNSKPYQEVYDGFLAEGVAIARPFPPLVEWARISVGTPEENELARSALRKIYS
jgi:histidinol-phosphate aminotransferase